MKLNLYLLILAVFSTVSVLAEKKNHLYSFEPTKDNVKILGRAIYQNSYLWFGMTDTGIEYSFNGQKTIISVTADTAAYSKDNPAYIAIYVDNKIYQKSIITEKDTNFTINFNKKGKHIITFIKLSESERGSLRINEIISDSKKIKPTAQKKKKIEFLGDSITCAYGIDGVETDSFSTLIQDGSKSYAYLTAKQFDADYSIVAHSGISIFKNVPFNDDDTPFTLPPLYDKLGLTMGPNIFDDGIYQLQTTTWDFNEFEPDLIVINLGTNDDYYFMYINPENVASEKLSFIQSYEDFITYLRDINPNAEILCTLGMMGQSLYPEIEQAVNNYTKKTGDKHVHSFKFNVQNGEKNGLGADGHPNAKSHLDAAQELIGAIEKIYGWKADKKVNKKLY